MEMDIAVSNRIHIIPLGFERDRVIVPPQEMGADKVVLIVHEKDEPEDQPDYYDEIFDELESSAIKTETIKCDIFDLYDALGTIAGLIQSLADEDIYVNLATGGKVTAIAGMIACMVTENAEPYYVHAKDYGDHQGTPIAQTVTGISNLPTYPIDAPSPEQIEILSRLESEGPFSKKVLIEIGEEEGLPFLANYEGDDPKGKYRKLDSDILNPLVEDGHAEVFERGREKMVRITNEGENTIEAFKYMLDEFTSEQ